MAKKVLSNSEIRVKVIAYGESLAPEQQPIFNTWVANQRRGFGKFCNKGNVIPSADVFILFNQYLAKCAKLGIDPSSKGKAGRRKKITVETPSATVTVEVHPDATTEEVINEVGTAVEAIAETC